MNIQNVNNTGNGDNLRNAEILKSDLAARTNQQSQTDTTASATAETQTTATTQPQTVNKAVDSYQASVGKEMIQELTNAVESMDEFPREQEIARVAQRVSEGYYNSPDFIGNVALKLINAEGVR